jgi:glycosyltransferase involved in cell wall biosynthesis
MKSKTTLVILVWNEIDAIKELFPLIPLDAVSETIVIDGGSNDGTAEFLKSKGIKVYQQKHRGRGNAFIEGLKHAKNDKIIFFSGDGNEDPNDIPKVAYWLDKGYDMVIAGRFILVGSQSDDSDDPLRIRKGGNILMSWIADVIWHTGVKDAINGFRGFKRPAMEKLKLDAPKHEVEIQSTIRAAKLGLKIKEIPTHELLRMGGRRKTTAGTFTLAKNLGIYMLREMFNGKRF